MVKTLLKIGFSVLLVGLSFFLLYTYLTPDYQYMQRTSVMLEIRTDGGQVVGHGSGVLVGNNKILTAGHIAQYLKADVDIFARFMGGESTSAKLVKMKLDSEEKYITDDIALLEIKNNHGYPSASLSCKSQPVGTSVYVVGNPMNSRWATTEGTVNSVIPRKGRERGSWLQIDATIWSGNSGGPIFNRFGHVVGVVSHSNSVRGGPTGFNFGVSGPTICEFLGE